MGIVREIPSCIIMPSQICLDMPIGPNLHSGPFDGALFPVCKSTIHISSTDSRILSLDTVNIDCNTINVDILLLKIQ